MVALGVAILGTGIADERADDARRSGLALMHSVPWVRHDDGHGNDQAGDDGFRRQSIHHRAAAASVGA